MNADTAFAPAFAAAAGAQSLRLGIDMGGTKVSGVILDGAGRELARHRLATPRTYGATLEALAALVLHLEHQCGQGPVASLGIALPGQVAGGRVTAVNLPWLTGQALESDLVRLFRRPVTLANDADCFTLSEALDGAGSETPSGVVFGAILGTGAGGGVVVNGRLLSGARGLAGEWGHVPLPWRDSADPPPRTCGCGRSDCLETMVSGGGLAWLHRWAGGDDCNAETVIVRAGAGDPVARRALTLHARALARGLALVITVLDPDVIVLGGGLSGLSSLYETVPSQWTAWTLPPPPRTRLVPARHGPDSGLRGAAWLS